MIPIIKAADLYLFMLNNTYLEYSENAKQRAIFVVDEIIKEYNLCLNSAPTKDLGLEYWQEVKKELEKL